MRFDLVLDNANIFTVDPALRRAGSIGIIGDRIVAVAQRGELARFDAGRTIDLDGHFVAPGFNDAHNHMQAYGATRPATNWIVSAPTIPSYSITRPVISPR